jgi:hypothetical protein
MVKPTQDAAVLVLVCWFFNHEIGFPSPPKDGLPKFSCSLLRNVVTKHTKEIGSSGFRVVRVFRGKEHQGAFNLEMAVGSTANHAKKKGNRLVRLHDDFTHKVNRQGSRFA